jgi:hypothetical protein
VQNCHPLDHNRYNHDQAAITSVLNKAIYGDPEKAAAAAEYIATHTLLSPDSVASGGNAIAIWPALQHSLKSRKVPPPRESGSRMRSSVDGRALCYRWLIIVSVCS